MLAGPDDGVIMSLPFFGTQHDLLPKFSRKLYRSMISRVFSHAILVNWDVGYFSVSGDLPRFPRPSVGN